MSEKKPTRRSRPELIWEDAHEIPVAGINPPVELRRRARYGRIAVWTTVIVAPLAVLLLFAQLLNDKPAEAADVSLQSAPGQAVAMVALQKWLDEDPAPVAGGRIVSWAGSATVTPPAPADDALGAQENAAPFPIERDRFVVVDEAGQTYHAELLVEVDPAGGATVLAGPALTPIPQARPHEAVEQYPEWGALPRVQVPDPVDAAVKAWARAYTSGDAAALMLTVGDQDGDHTYLPLQGVSVKDIQALTGATLPDNRMAVRVELALTDRSAISYDVLVERAETAAPVVVAWGAPGAGPTLTPYENALPRDIPVSTEGSESGPPVASESESEVVNVPPIESADETPTTSEESTTARKKPQPPKTSAPGTDATPKDEKPSTASTAGKKATDNTKDTPTSSTNEEPPASSAATPTSTSKPPVSSTSATTTGG